MFEYKVPPRITCPNCGFKNSTSSAQCQICQRAIKKNNLQPNSVSGEKDYWSSQLDTVHEYSLTKNHQPNRNKPKFNDRRGKERLKNWQKSLNLMGIILIVALTIIWVNFLFFSQENTVSSTNRKRVSDAPKGLFNYGGGSIFAPLVVNGLNSEIEANYPGFYLRYAKPLNRDFSDENGIKMLLNGELSFAYSGRSLTDAEYQRASLRNIRLKQVPLAIDGIVVFGNLDLPISQLNRAQLEAIFKGEMTNWREINPETSDLPIIPVILNHENYQMLGMDKLAENESTNTETAINYTRAIRKVISTPGAISLASASLVKEQKLIKMISLSEGSSHNYVSPLIGEELNLQAFEDGTYPLTRRLFLVYRQDGTMDEKAGKAYLDYLVSEPGQRIVTKSGFVSVY